MGDNNNKDGKKNNQKLKILNNRCVLPDISGNSTKKITISDDICKNNNLFNLVLHKGNEIIKRDTHISTINIDITNEKNDNKDKEIKPYTGDLSMTIDNLLKKIQEETGNHSNIINGLDRYSLKTPLLENENNNEEEKSNSSKRACNSS